MLTTATPQINYGQFLTTFLLQILCCNLKNRSSQPRDDEHQSPWSASTVIPMSTGNPYPYTQFGHQTTFEKSERPIASVALTIKSKFQQKKKSSVTKSTGRPGRPLPPPNISHSKRLEQPFALIAKPQPQPHV